MKKILWVIAATIALASCATEPQFLSNSTNIGSIYSTEVAAPYGDILLPPGQWRLVGESTSISSNNQLFKNAVLARIDAKNNLDGLVMYSQAIDKPEYQIPHLANTYCTPKPVTLYSDQSPQQNDGHEQCFFIEDWPLSAGSNATPHVKQAENFFRNNGVVKPESMLFSNFLISDNSKRLIVHYGFNYRQPTKEMLPGFQPIYATRYNKNFGTDLWKKNLETVIAWSKETEYRIRSTFLD